MDFLDILSGRFYQTNPANYYENLPTPEIFPADPSESVEPEPFDFEFVDPTEWHYKQLLGGLIDREAATATIKTRDAIRFRQSGYVTFDSRLFAILSVTQDTRSANREAMRYTPVPLGTEYILRLVEIENPWGIDR